MVSDKEELEQIYHKHPNWAESNIQYLAKAKGLDFFRDETLLEASCTKCTKEMGEHKWTGKEFICP